MSSSWAGGCPCKDCNFKTKNSYPLVNYVRNCDYQSRYTPKEKEDFKTITDICSLAKMCFKQGCAFKSTHPYEIISHVQECPLPWDEILINQIAIKYDKYKASKSAGFSASRGKKFS